MWMKLQHTRLEPSDDDSFDGILAFLHEHADYSITPTRRYFLDMHSRFYARANGMRTRMIQRLLEFAKRRGYDLDYVASDGATPLLSHLRSHYGTSLAIVRALLKLGANPHATDLDNRNGIQLAMWSNVASGVRDYSLKFSLAEFSDMLQAKFELLIRTGVNLEHRDGKGRTLSQTARDCNCWEIWCSALKQCGKPVEEVVHDVIE